MPVYTYKGYEALTGKNTKGKVEAESPKAARTKLRQKNKIIVAELKEEASLEKVKGKATLFSSKVNLRDLAVMTRQFATLQNAHVPLDESLSALTAQVEHVVLRNALANVKEQVQEGKSLGDALGAFPGVFNRLYVNMVRAGESAGTLGIVLERLADFLEYQDRIRSQVLSAMTYPLLMIGASGLIIVYLFVSVVPKLQKVFVSLRIDLPTFTKAIIGFSEFLQNYWYVAIGMVALGYFGIRAWLSSDKGRKTWDRWALKLPVFGQLILRLNVSKFTRTLATLLSSGVPIIRSLEITRNVVQNEVISAVLEQAKIAVQEGQSLASTIEKSHQFPPLVTHMIATGEKTGELENMLGHVAKAYDAEVERKIDAMISIIEPMMIIVMSAIIVVVVVALLVPMLSIMKKVR